MNLVWVGEVGPSGDIYDEEAGDQSATRLIG